MADSNLLLASIAGGVVVFLTIINVIPRGKGSSITSTKPSSTTTTTNTNTTDATTLRKRVVTSDSNSSNSSASSPSSSSSLPPQNANDDNEDTDENDTMSIDLDEWKAKRHNARMACDGLVLLILFAALWHILHQQYDIEVGDVFVKYFPRESRLVQDLLNGFSQRK